VAVGLDHDLDEIGLSNETALLSKVASSKAIPATTASTAGRQTSRRFREAGAAALVWK
jgi:hypothetical protein